MVIDPPPPIKEIIPLCLIKNKILPAVAAVAVAAVAEEPILSLLDKETDLEIVDSDTIEEVNLDFNDIKESITLKKPNDVYYEIYKAAREKAKNMRKVAIEAYLEAKEIKTKYMLTDIDDSDEEDL